jgi:hypothetical protein
VNLLDKKLHLPIEFEQIINVMDDRFIRVKIWIAHTGENRNNSVFSKELLESMIPSLADIPILGYIATDENGNIDFKGHQEKLVIENNEFKFKYMGRAYGLIPETNNAHFEYRYGDDGVEREYLVTEGVLWRKFPEVEQIFERDGGFKSQSMELYAPSVEGYVDDQGLFVFTKAKFEGACILGEGVTPAMVSSTIEKFSVANNIKTEFSEMLKEFNTHFTQVQQKGDDTVGKDNENLEPTNPEVTPVEPVAEPAPQSEPVVEPQVEPETQFQNDPEPVEPVVEPAPQPEPEVAPEPEATPEPESTQEPAVPEKFSITFELTHSDIRRKIYDQLDAHMKDAGVNDPNNPWDDSYWIVDIYETYLVCEDLEGDNFFKVDYQSANDEVTLGAVVEVFPMFLTQAEKSAIDISRSNFTALEQEVTELRSFKAGIELGEKEAKINSYASILSKEEMDTIKENINKFSVVDIEKEIGFMLLKKNHFSANNHVEPEQPAKVGAVAPDEPFQYGTLSKYFTKNN